MPPRIVIAICTRGRAARLQRLLASLAKQSDPVGYDVQILIIDNNDNPQVAAPAQGKVGAFPLSIVHEPNAGLVFARNTALDHAERLGATWIMGVDDDEWVADTWLAEMIAGIEAFPEVGLFIGPRQVTYSEGLSMFCAPRRVPDLPVGARPKRLLTANYALHHHVFDRNHRGLRFDHRFNQSGAEDVEFFERIVYRFGISAAWLPEALVFEDRTGSRATLMGNLKRSVVNKSNDMRIRRLQAKEGYKGTTWSVLAHAVRAMARHIVFGSASVLFGAVLFPFSRARGSWYLGRGLYRFALLAGLILGLLGHAPKAYGAGVEPT